MPTRESDPESGKSEAVTRGIRVSVEAVYAPEHSQPSQNHWFFLYSIRIANEGEETVQLISRHWLISDGLDRVQEIRGLGVVGQQPVLEPGGSFSYTSGCPLGTPFGSMRGTFQMVTGDGEQFDSVIAPFTLQAPYSVH
jgi:ApaG protein